jgi:hypothetical protein
MENRVNICTIEGWRLEELTVLREKGTDLCRREMGGGEIGSSGTGAI